MILANALAALRQIKRKVNSRSNLATTAARSRTVPDLIFRNADATEERHAALGFAAPIVIAVPPDPATDESSA